MSLRIVMGGCASSVSRSITEKGFQEGVVRWLARKSRWGKGVLALAFK